ncbi:MAG: hypothetical protein IT370_35275 [Deltaproteobacteria bacterium]|nr:hypothetical protein [Deltaproteobacteria bacterium]
MTAVALVQRLERVEGFLKKIGEAVTAGPLTLPDTVEAATLDLANCHVRVGQWRSMLAARESAMSILDRLENMTDPESGLVTIAGAAIGFAEARLILVQGYLVSSWALADSICDLAGRIVCVDDVAKNPMNSPKLVKHFIRKEKKGEGQATTGLLFAFSRRTFGWPVGLSNTMRNLFAHDGGYREGWAFFKARTPSAGFAISDDGWNYVLESAKKDNGIGYADTRAPEPWPWPQDDLRKVLKICTREMDDALGTLAGSAVAILRAHVEHLVGII